MIIYQATWLHHMKQGNILNRQKVKNRLLSYYYTKDFIKYFEEYYKKGTVKVFNEEKKC
jgi:hypothetical protein